MAWNASQVASLMNSPAALQQNSGGLVRPGIMLLVQAGIALLSNLWFSQLCLPLYPVSETRGIAKSTRPEDRLPRLEDRLQRPEDRLPSHAPIIAQTKTVDLLTEQTLRKHICYAPPRTTVLTESLEIALERQKSAGFTAGGSARQVGCRGKATCGQGRHADQSDREEAIERRMALKEDL
eukprot:1275502-Amphidinium_carterae.1